jgi:hypothetical protein
MRETEVAQREMAIHLLRAGNTPREVAKELERSLAWVYKWRERFYAQQDWHALEDQSHRPKHCPKKLPESVRQAVRLARSELEAEAKLPGKLSYIGAQAIWARLRKNQVVPLPSSSSIERELRAAHLTQPPPPVETVEVVYPHVHPTRPLQLIQVDIVPRYLPGGGCVSCFNGIDVVSHYPTGQQQMTKHSEDAVQFLLSVWQDIGLAEYTQVDNEGCFSGGFTHPGVLGKVLRLALLVGTQLVFSPVRHPESNATVERFHQDYLKNVWDKVELPDLSAVQAYSPVFFEAFRHSEQQTALRGRAPAELHPPSHRLPADFPLPERLPLTVGQVHFIRRVSAEKRITLLNLEWEVPAGQPDQGVWATLEFSLQGATLRVFDTAPDTRQRSLLAEHPFPLKEEVQPLADLLQRPIATDEWQLFQPTSEPTLYRLFGLVSTML